MHGYNFTERVRKAMAMAREEAVARDHEYVGTEHLLLGLVREGEGVAAAVLQRLHVDVVAVVRRIDEIVARGKPDQSTGPDLPYTSRAKKVVEMAMAEARLMSHSYVGTEHLLLGLIREEQGIAAQVLTAAGASLDAVRAETVRLLGATEEPFTRHPSTGRVVSVAVRVRFADGSDVRDEFGSVASALAFLARHQ